MKGFSFGRVAQYARYHYTTQQKSYISFVLMMFAVPLFFGILSRSVDTTVEMAVVVYLAGALGIARSCIKPLRDRGTKIMESVVPVPSSERMVFYLLNCIVAFPIVAFVTASLAVVVTVPFCYYEVNIAEAIIEMGRSTYFLWELFVVVQIIASSSLLINVAARRSLVIAYAGAVVGFGAFIAFVSRVGINVLANYADELANMESINLNIPDWVGISIYVAIPVTLYAIAYLVLRKRQIKW